MCVCVWEFLVWSNTRCCCCSPSALIQSSVTSDSQSIHTTHYVGSKKWCESRSYWSDTGKRKNKITRWTERENYQTLRSETGNFCWRSMASWVSLPCLCDFVFLFYLFFRLTLRITHHHTQQWRNKENQLLSICFGHKSAILLLAPSPLFFFFCNWKKKCLVIEKKKERIQVQWIDII